MDGELIKEKFKNVDKVIESHEKRINNLEKTYSIMEKMDYRVSQIEKTIAQIDEKLDASNEEKGKKWDKLIDYLFYFLIATLLAYLSHQIGVR